MGPAGRGQAKTLIILNFRSEIKVGRWPHRKTPLQQFFYFCIRQLPQRTA
jgi:hypothetical protein